MRHSSTAFEGESFFVGPTGAVPSLFASTLAADAPGTRARRLLPWAPLGRLTPWAAPLDGTAPRPPLAVGCPRWRCSSVPSAGYARDR